MKLPDFAQAIEFIRLRQQMGAILIPPLPKVEFVRETIKTHVVKVIDEKDKQLLEKLRSGIEVSRKDLQSEDGFLTLGGRKVVAYIRDQRQSINEHDGTSNYRFHLRDCATMRSMRGAGRERRYVATHRSDGRFEVNYSPKKFVRNIGWDELRNVTVLLKLCQHCRYELARKGEILYQDPFSLKRYFERHESRVPRTVRRIETVKHVQKYQPNQKELSEEYREAAGYRCQVCKVDCREEQGLLQLHHQNGDTSDNAHHNLAVLCVDCHAREPYHGQMGRSASDQARIARIRKLRRQQNLTLSNPRAAG